MRQIDECSLIETHAVALKSNTMKNNQTILKVFCAVVLLHTNFLIVLLVAAECGIVLLVAGQCGI